MFCFLMAQWKDPIKGDGYSNILEIMQEFEHGDNEEDIRYIPVKKIQENCQAKEQKCRS